MTGGGRSSTRVGGVEGRRRWRSRPFVERLRTIGIGVVAIWIAVEAGRLFGVSDVLDANFRRLFYSVRGERPTGTDVVLVAIDEPSISAWGPPPWPRDVVEPLVDTVLEGGPRIVAVLEPWSRIAHTSPDEAWLPTDDRVVVPPTGLVQDLPTVAIEPGGFVEAIALHGSSESNARSVTRRVAARLGLADDAAPVLPVNFIGNDPPPTLSSHRIVRGEIPPGTFEDRVVLLGTVSSRLGAHVRTPVGAMSASEVHAHALAGLADGAVWRRVPAWLRLCWTLAIGALAIVMLPRLRVAAMLGVLSAATGTILLLDYVAFSGGTLLVGSADPLFGLATAAAFGVLVERRRVQAELERFAALGSQRWGTDAFDLADVDDDRMFWQRIIASVERYVPYDAAVVAVLPEGEWHLELTAFVRGSVEAVTQRRRDIRREPYRDAYMLHRAVWSSRPFVQCERDTKTLIVPLIAFRRVVAVWVFEFGAEHEIGEREIAMLSMLADHAAVAAGTRAERGGHAEPADTPNGGGLLEDRVAALARTARTLAHTRERSARVLAEFPSAAMVATMWGAVEYANRPMRRILRAFGIPDPAGCDLHRLLATVTEHDESEIEDLLRALCGRVPTAEIDTSVRESDGGVARFDIVIARTGTHTGDAGDDAGVDAGLSRIVVSAWPRRESADRRGPYATTISDLERALDRSALPSTDTGVSGDARRTTDDASES